MNTNIVRDIFTSAQVATGLLVISVLLYLILLRLERTQKRNTAR